MAVAQINMAGKIVYKVWHIEEMCTKLEQIKRVKKELSLTIEKTIDQQQCVF